MSSLGKKMQIQYGVLGYRIDLCFLDHQLAIVVDENGHSNKTIGNEIKRKKAIEQELDCKFI